MMPVEPTALSHRDVLRSSSTATWNPASTGPMAQPDRAVEVDLGRGHGRVPSLSFSRRIRNPFGVVPSMLRGTAKQPRPRVPLFAPSGRAVMTNRSASATEQNHFSPLMRHPSTTAGSGTARATLAPTSDPPCTSVRNCEGAQARRVVAGVQAGQEAVPLGLAAPVLEGRGWHRPCTRRGRRGRPRRRGSTGRRGRSARTALGPRARRTASPTPRWRDRPPRRRGGTRSLPAGDRCRRRRHGPGTLDGPRA